MPTPLVETKIPISRGKGRLLWLVVHIMYMIKRTMLIFMPMSKKFLIMIKVIIMLLYLFIIIDMLCLHRALLMLIVEIGLGVIMLCLMRLGKHAIVLPLFIMHVMILLYSHAKMQKWLLENWDPNARETRLAFGFQKSL
jgi:hypothetical protein